MSVRRSAPGATPIGSGEPASVTSISGHGRGFRWQNSRKSYACSFGSTARLAWTKFWPSPAVIPVSLPFLMSRRISRGWRVSISIPGFYLCLGCRRLLRVGRGRSLQLDDEGRPNVQHGREDADRRLLGAWNHDGHFVVTRREGVRYDAG